MTTTGILLCELFCSTGILSRHQERLRIAESSSSMLKMLSHEQLPFLNHFLAACLELLAHSNFPPFELKLRVKLWTALVMCCRVAGEILSPVLSIIRGYTMDDCYLFQLYRNVEDIEQYQQRHLP